MLRYEHCNGIVTISLHGVIQGDLLHKQCTMQNTSIITHIVVYLHM